MGAINQIQTVGNSTGQTRFLEQANCKKSEGDLKIENDPSTKCNVLTLFGS